MAVKGVLGKLVRTSTNTRGYLVCLVLVRLPLAFFQKRDSICTWEKNLCHSNSFFLSIFFKLFVGLGITFCYQLCVCVCVCVQAQLGGKPHSFAAERLDQCRPFGGELFMERILLPSAM